MGTPTLPTNKTLYALETHENDIDAVRGPQELTHITVRLALPKRNKEGHYSNDQIRNTANSTSAVLLPRPGGRVGIRNETNMK
jgi:hypothetical protein